MKKYRKDVTIEDFMIAGAYYRLLKDVSAKLYIHLADKVFLKNETGQMRTLDDRIKGLEVQMGLEDALFHFIDHNLDKEDVKAIKRHDTSVFYGNLKFDQGNIVDDFEKDFLKKKFAEIFAANSNFRINNYLIEPLSPGKWVATIEGNAEAINYIEDIVQNIFEKNKEDEKND
jgi:hypothetical protein